MSVQPGRLLAALNDAEVAYVVIGGFAVIANGVVRTTQDLDVLTPATRRSGAEIAALLTSLGATRQDGSALPEFLFDGEHHVRALTPFGLLDVVPEGASPLTYSEVADTASRVLVDGTEAPVCDLAHLVAFKRLAGRPRDRADLADLEVAHGPLPDLLGDAR